MELFFRLKMARSRNIKPGFFTNDVLGELPPLTRLLFAGLWTICDRDGRIEDRPKKIRAELLPYDDCDPDEMLQALENKGFILRYQACEIRAIQVLAWEKHQNPHVKEAASTIQAPDKHQTSTRQAQPLPERAGLIPSSLIPSSLIPSSLIPDSSPLIPSSLIPEVSPTALVGSPPDGTDADLLGQPVKPADRRIPCPADALLEAFHAECPTLPRVMKLNDKRRDHLRARWKEVDADSKFTSAEDGVEIFRAVFRKVHSSDFLAGRAKDWHATFDWITESSTNFLKVCEGHYDNETRGQPARSKQPDWMAGAI